MRAWRLKCHCLLPGQDASATVTSVFDLYGNGVEPFGSSQTSAIQKALAQSAGHGVADKDISISVLSTYTDQQNVSTLQPTSTWLATAARIWTTAPQTRPAAATQCWMATLPGLLQVCHWATEHVPLACSPGGGGWHRTTSSCSRACSCRRRQKRHSSLRLMSHPALIMHCPPIRCIEKQAFSHI